MDEAQVQNLADTALAEMGRMDIWVNNAGGMQGERPAVLRQHTPETFGHIIDLNFVAVWRCIRSSPRWPPRVGGRIINVSSTASLRDGDADERPLRRRRRPPPTT